MTVKVVVAIVGYRNAEDIRQCLEALSHSTYTDFDVVICENGGEAAYSALNEVIPNVLPAGQSVRVLQADRNLGYAGGVNRCLTHGSEADAWWVLNPDTSPEPGALEALVTRMVEGPYDMVGGIIYKADGSIQTCGGRWRPWLARAESIGNGWPVDREIDAAVVERAMNYVSGASMLVSAHYLRCVGLMREDYFLYAEEIEWCLRGSKQGMRLGFASKARILHGHGTTTGSGVSYRSRPRLPIFLDERNKMLVTWDHFPWRMPVASVMALLLIVMRFPRRGAFRQWGYATAGWLAGLFGRRGIPST